MTLGPRCVLNKNTRYTMKKIPRNIQQDRSFTDCMFTAFAMHGLDETVMTGCESAVQEMG